MKVRQNNSAKNAFSFPKFYILAKEKSIFAKVGNLRKLSHRKPAQQKYFSRYRQSYQMYRPKIG